MKKTLFLTLMLSASLVSCQMAEDEPFRNQQDTSEEQIIEDAFSRYAIIGEKQSNPLSMDNILNAFEQLDTKTRSGLKPEDIKATHRYIAFTPSNEDELYALDDIDENQIMLSSYPLDYEVSDGIIVPDERFVTNGFSYRWAYVPVDYDLEQIACPYIYYYDIFSPNEEVSTRANISYPEEFTEALEILSYKLCGYDITPAIETKSSNVTPYGRIRFYDQYSNSYRGVDGLSIRTVRGTHSSYTHCDADGNFTSTDSFKHKFRYEIHFSRTDFAVRRGDSTDEIVVKYTDYEGPIFKDLNDEELNYFAVISRAAIVYYYGDNCGLRRPPMKSDNTARLAIQAQLGSDPDMYGFFTVNNRWVLSDRPIVNIYMKEKEEGDTDKIRKNYDIYATTMHELSHASHWRNNQSTFNETSNEVIESFARGVQWILAKAVYPDYIVPFYYRQSYTGVVQDLIDGYGIKSTNSYATWIDDKLQKFNCKKQYDDQVTGFTPTMIEEAVRKSKTWNEWQHNLINDNKDVASAMEISASFTYWNSSY